MFIFDKDTVINKLVLAITNNDEKAIAIIRRVLVRNMGAIEYGKIYKQAFYRANSINYKFNDFSTKVFSNNDD